MKIDKSYFFFMYLGLLNLEYYDKIGLVLWLFFWFISVIIKEIKKDGVSWGIVFGYKLLKVREMVVVFGVSEKIVRRWLEFFEIYEYIKVVCVLYGLMIFVKYFKKFSFRLDKIVYWSIKEWLFLLQVLDIDVCLDKDKININIVVDDVVDYIVKWFI